MSKTLLALALAALSASAAAATPGQSDPYPSSYRIVPSAPVLLQHATVLTGTGERLDDADVLMADGRVVSVGQGLQAPTGATGGWRAPISRPRPRKCPCLRCVG